MCCLCCSTHTMTQRGAGVVLYYGPSALEQQSVASSHTFYLPQQLSNSHYRLLKDVGLQHSLQLLTVLTVHTVLNEHAKHQGALALFSGCPEAIITPLIVKSTAYQQRRACM